MSYPVGRPAVNRVAMDGKRFGRLTVLKEASAVRHIRMFLCKCECGNEKTVRGTNLRSGNTSCCGCASKIKHGHTVGRKTSPEYRSWDHMRQRCTNPENDGYADYGGRGIKVCGEWHEFSTFLRDMGQRPPRTSLDRIDNNGSYEPSNCRWATQSQQNYNRRKRAKRKETEKP